MSSDNLQTTARPGQGPILLVVDDDPMVRKILVRGLESLAPAEIIEAEDGQAAQARLLENAVDVVVTDVVMPRMDGLELMKWAQANCPGPLWIILSGLETFDAAIDALHLGAFDYLAKPPEVQRVRVAVRNALDQIELVRDRQRLYAELAESAEQLAEKVEQLEEANRVLEDQAAVIQADLDRAEIIQRALLPQAPPRVSGWCMDTLYRPGSSVGGDFYDAILLDRDHLALVIADAAGHGVAAAMISVLFKTRLHPMGQGGEILGPAQVLQDLNHTLFQTLSAPGTFITAAYVLINLRQGLAQFASAGHTPCVWTSPGGEVRLLQRTGPALGLDAAADYTQSELTIEPGDRLLLYTDGVTDGGAESPDVEQLGQAMCADTAHAELLGPLYESARHGVTGDRDDITLLLLERAEGDSRFDDTPTREQRAETQFSEMQPHLRLGARSGHAFLSISGAATWLCSQSLLDAARDLLRQHGRLTIDLADCENLDSTCLGTLHELVTEHSDVVLLQRVPEKIRRLFDELSMCKVMEHISKSSEDLPDDMQALLSDAVAPDQQGKRILRAHETLAALSEGNREQFAAVVESLRADLARKGQDDDRSGNASGL
ncbi:response regulator [Seongchinamella unica]|uniref:Response regulator n=1 Tax=Seongchinamella unica TaxID=2547392 RepID=A0A4R5LMW1_9GAMM|nr:SpoIIE family protein phosphatase [Seongchinamella unica]TDG11400.1 response regulator [Seongchinamella unica]